jgi:maltose alpha-D-glucosyltransferase/alpha-amylase
MIAIRREHHAFGRGDFEWMDVSNSHIAAFKRTYRDESILAIHNLGNTTQTVSVETKKSVITLTDLLSGKEFPSNAGYVEVELAPYQFRWLR